VTDERARGEGRSLRETEPGHVRAGDELPVVARMVIEVRSDGTRTLARGAMEDLVTGQQVAIETPAMTPLELAAHLSRTVLAVQGLAAGAVRDGVRALVPERVRQLKRRLLG
jgi:hypothetical protein